jgi:hypothetical protein
VTVKEIHARRKQLEEQAGTARSSYYPAHQAQGAAEAEVRAAKGARMDALVNEAKGLEADVDGALARESKAHAALEESKARGEAVRRAREETELALKDFLAEHFEVFAEDAMKLTTRAEEGLHRANKAIMLAEGLWRNAQAAWAPLCSAKGISPVPPFPISGVSPVPARPPAVSVEKVDEAAA